MMARRGQINEAWTRLEQLSAENIGLGRFEHGHIVETRGYLKHLRNPNSGASDYINALATYIAVGKDSEAKRLCSASPFKLSECQRLGYPNEQNREPSFE